MQSAVTGLAVLKMLATMGGGASLSRLAGELQESPAKVHRYLASLVAADFVRQEGAGGHYVLGTESIAIGLAAMRQSDVLTLAGEELAKLAEDHQLSCCLAVLGNYGPTLVRWHEPVLPVSVNARVGSVLPVLWSATGRAFGAFSGVAALRKLIDAELANSTPKQRSQLPNRKAVEALFEQIRSLRCAPLRDVLLEGVSAVACPIFNASGAVAAVITALGPSGGFDPTPGGSEALLVMRAADSLSAKLGYPAPAK